MLGQNASRQCCQLQFTVAKGWKAFCTYIAIVMKTSFRLCVSNKSACVACFMWCGDHNPFGLSHQHPGFACSLVKTLTQFLAPQGASIKSGKSYIPTPAHLRCCDTFCFLHKWLERERCHELEKNANHLQSVTNKNLFTFCGTCCVVCQEQWHVFMLNAVMWFCPGRSSRCNRGVWVWQGSEDAQTIGLMP